jgi:hypothetical protein
MPMNLLAAFCALTYDIVWPLYMASDPKTLITDDFGEGLHRSFAFGFYLLRLLPNKFHERVIGWILQKGQSIVQEVCVYSFSRQAKAADFVA